MITIHEKQAIKMLESLEQLAYGFKEYCPNSKFSGRNTKIAQVSLAIKDLIQDINKPNHDKR